MSVFIITLLRSSTRSRLILFVNVDKVVCWTSWAVSCVLWQEGNLCGGFATQTYTYLLDRYSGELWFVSKSGFQRWWNLKQSYHPDQSQRTPTVVKECSCRVLTNHIAAFYHVTASGPIRWLDLHIQDGWHENMWQRHHHHHHHHFFMSRETRAYCKSDVKLLKGCQKFHQEFQQHADFDPIEKCMTTASACNHYWQRNWSHQTESPRNHPRDSMEVKPISPSKPWNGQ